MTKKTNTEKLLSATQAANLKGVSRAAIYRAIGRGALPAVEVIGHVGLREADVLAWQPVAYKGRPGAKGRGGRRKGKPLSAEEKARISEGQKRRWEKRRELTA
jgi:excisionase family DNA binding protein